MNLWNKILCLLTLSFFPHSIRTLQDNFYKSAVLKEQVCVTTYEIRVCEKDKNPSNKNLGKVLTVLKAKKNNYYSNLMVFFNQGDNVQMSLGFIQ